MALDVLRFALPFSTPIVWHAATRTRDLPDSDTTVLVHIAEGGEPVWLGYWDAAEQAWKDIDGQPLGLVTMWADIPHPTDDVCIQPELLDRLRQRGVDACQPIESPEGFSFLLNHFLKLGLDAFDQARDKETEDLF